MQAQLHRPGHGSHRRSPVAAMHNRADGQATSAVVADCPAAVERAGRAPEPVIVNGGHDRNTRIAARIEHSRADQGKRVMDMDDVRGGARATRPSGYGGLRDSIRPGLEATPSSPGTIVRSRRCWGRTSRPRVPGPRAPRPPGRLHGSLRWANPSGSGCGQAGSSSRQGHLTSPARNAFPRRPDIEMPWRCGMARADPAPPGSPTSCLLENLGRTVIRPTDYGVPRSLGPRPGAAKFAAEVSPVRRGGSPD